jgi:hypothetical protein
MSWVSPPGDYAIVNSNHIPDGTNHVMRARLIEIACDPSLYGLKLACDMQEVAILRAGAALRLLSFSATVEALRRVYRGSSGKRRSATQLTNCNVEERTSAKHGL